MKVNESVFYLENGNTPLEITETYNSKLSLKPQTTIIPIASENDLVTFQTKKKYENVIGLILIVLSCACFSTTSLLLKLSNQEGLPVLHIIAFRSFGMLMIAGIYLLMRQINPFQVHKNPDFINDRKFCLKLDTVYWLLLSLAVLRSVGQGCFLAAAVILPLGDATALFFTSPFFATVCSYLWLKEKPPVYFIFVVIFSLAGTILVARPSFIFGVINDSIVLTTKEKAIGVTLCLLGALASGTTLCVIRKIGKRATSTTMIFFFGLVSTPSFMILSWSCNHTAVELIAYTNYKCWLYNLGIVFFTFLALMLLNKGIQLEGSVGIGSFLRSITVVFSFIYQVTVTGQSAHYLSIIGAVLIIMCSVIVVLSRVMEDTQFSRSLERYCCVV